LCSLYAVRRPRLRKIQLGEFAVVFSSGTVIGLRGVDLGMELAEGNFFAVNGDVRSPTFCILTPIHALETRSEAGP
jgi:hypothetical protein